MLHLDLFIHYILYSFSYENNLSKQSGTQKSKSKRETSVFSVKTKRYSYLSQNQNEKLPFFCQVRIFSNLDRYLIQNGCLDRKFRTVAGYNQHHMLHLSHRLHYYFEHSVSADFAFFDRFFDRPSAHWCVLYTHLDNRNHVSTFEPNLWRWSCRGFWWPRVLLLLEFIHRTWFYDVIVNIILNKHNTLALKNYVVLSFCHVHQK